MEKFVSFLLLVASCQAYFLPWNGEIPIKEVVEVHEKTTIKKIYDTAMLKDILEIESAALEATTTQKKLEFRIQGGENCGPAGSKEVIHVDKLSLPDVLVLGGNATISVAVTVSGVRKTATLLSVVMKKKGLPFDIPCAQGLGTCNYTNPCQMLDKIQCPAAIVAQGWNCRCPIPVNHYSFGPVTATLPTVPLPAFLVNGVYDVTARLYMGSEELLCYHVTAAVKEKTGY